MNWEPQNPQQARIPLPGRSTSDMLIDSLQSHEDHRVANFGIFCNPPESKTNAETCYIGLLVGMTFALMDPASAAEVRALMLATTSAERDPSSKLEEMIQAILDGFDNT